MIVGPRSALFTPLPALGLIVLDECHDPAYHQEDTPPNYDAVESAIAYARLAGCLIVLGSATPDVSLYHRALQEHWTLLQLPVRILAHRKAVEAQLAQLGTALPETRKEPLQRGGICRSAEPAPGENRRYAPGIESRKPHHFQPRAARIAGASCSKTTSRPSCFLTGAARPPMFSAASAATA